jgi:uncharacterized membrane protein
MKKWFTLAVAVAVVGFTGCSSNSEKSGKVKGSGDNELYLTAPDDVTIKPGDEAKATVKIDRKGGWDENVDIKFDDLPKGVDVEGGSSQKIDKGNKEKIFTLKADKKAEEKKQTVKVTAKAKDMTLTKQFKVEVKK